MQCFQNSLEIFKHVCIGDAEYPVSGLLKRHCARAICANCAWLTMRGTIDFDNQLSLATEKIREEAFHRCLANKLEPTELTVAKCAP